MIAKTKYCWHLVVSDAALEASARCSRIRGMQNENNVQSVSLDCVEIKTIGVDAEHRSENSVLPSW